MTTGERR